MISINYTIDGGTSAITTGSKGYVSIPFDCTIISWTLVADQEGSIEIDIFKSTYAGFPDSATITGTELPTLSVAQKNQDTSLTTWTTAITAGDILNIYVNSADTVTKVTLILTVQK